MEHFKKSYSGDLLKVLLALSLGVNIAAGFFIFYQYKNMSIVGQKGKSKEGPTLVRTYKVNKGEISQQKTFSGSIKSVDAADLAFVHQGILDYIGFKPGTFVKKGTLLLGLRDGQQRAEYQESIAQEKNAKFNYEQVKKLYEKGYQPKAVMEEKQAAYEVTKAKVMAAKFALENTKIYAAFDGIIGILANDVVIGSPIEANKTLVRLIRGNALEVDFSPSESDVRHLSKGQSIMIYPNEQTNQHPVPAVIQAIDSYADSNSHTVKVRGLIKGSAAFLRDGAGVTVKVDIGKRKEVLVVPKDCVDGDETNGFFVYQIIAQNGKLYGIQKFITLGLSDLYKYEIEEGLDPNTLLVEDASRMYRFPSVELSVFPDDPSVKDLQEKLKQSSTDKDLYSHALKSIENKK